MQKYIFWWFSLYGLYLLKPENCEGNGIVDKFDRSTNVWNCFQPH